jgi:hypothetical protein
VQGMPKSSLNGGFKFLGGERESKLRARHVKRGCMNKLKKT